MKYCFSWISIILFSWIFIACNDDGGKGIDVPYLPDQPIVLTNVSPVKGGLGTRVVITGNNFGNDKSKVKVFFNEKEAIIFNMNNQHIYAMCPKQPGDSSVIRVKIDNNEGVLPNQKFAYQIQAVVTTVAGSGETGSDNGPALEATFGRVAMVDVDDKGNVIIADDRKKEIRLLSIEDNKVTTLLSGTGEVWQGDFSFDYENYYVLERSDATRPLLLRSLNRKMNWSSEAFYDTDNLSNKHKAYGLTVDDRGNIYVITTEGQELIKIDQSDKKMQRIGINLGLASWVHMAYNPVDKYIYCTVEEFNTVYRFNPLDVPVTPEKIEIFAGEPSAGEDYMDGNGKDARFGNMEGICCDREGNIYVADFGNNCIRKIDIHANVTTVAGVPGVSGYRDGKPKEALFNMPYDVAVTPDGILYVADTGNNRVRCVAIQ